MDDFWERVLEYRRRVASGEIEEGQAQAPKDDFWSRYEAWSASQEPPPPPPGPPPAIPEYQEPGLGRTIQGHMQDIPGAIQALPGAVAETAVGVKDLIAEVLSRQKGVGVEQAREAGYSPLMAGGIEGGPGPDMAALSPELQPGYAMDELPMAEQQLAPEETPGYAIDELPVESLDKKTISNWNRIILGNLKDAGVVDDEGKVSKSFAAHMGGEGSVLWDMANRLTTKLKGGDPNAAKEAAQTVRALAAQGLIDERPFQEMFGAMGATILDVAGTYAAVGTVMPAGVREGLRQGVGRRKAEAAIGALEGLPADIARAVRREDEGAGTVGLGTGLGATFGAVFPGGQTISKEVQDLIQESLKEAGGKGEAEAVKRFYQKIAKTPTEAVLRMPDGTIVGQGHGLRSHIEGSFHEDEAIRNDWLVAGQNGAEPGFLTREGTFLYGQGTVDQPTGFGHAVPDDQKLLPPPRRTEAGETIFEGQPPGKLQEEEIARGMARGREAAEQSRRARAAEEERLVAEGRSLPPGPAPESRQIGRGRVAVEDSEGVTMKTVREAGPPAEEMTDADFIRFARQYAEESRRARQAEIEAGRTLPEPAPKSRQIPAESSAPRDEPTVRPMGPVEERVLTDFEGQMPARRPAPESRQIPPRTEGNLARGREAEAFREGESLREGVRQTSRLTEELRRGRAAGTIPELPPAPREAPPTPAPKAEAPAPKPEPVPEPKAETPWEYNRKTKTFQFGDKKVTFTPAQRTALEKAGVQLSGLDSPAAVDAAQKALRKAKDDWAGTKLAYKNAQRNLAAVKRGMLKSAPATPAPTPKPKPKAKPKPKRAKDMTADELKEAARKADEGVRATQEKFGTAKPKPKPKAAPKETAAPGFTKTQTTALQKAGVDPATLNTSEGIEVARRQMMEAFWDLDPADKPAHKGAQGVLNKMAKEGPTAPEPTPAKAPARSATKPAPAPEGKVADGHPAPSVKKSHDFSETGEWIVQDAVNPMQRHTRIFYDQQSGMWHEVVPKKGGKGNDFVPIPSKNKADAIDILRQRWAGERAEALAKRGPKPKPKPKAEVKVKPKGMGYKNQWTLTSGENTTTIQRGEFAGRKGWWELVEQEDGSVKRHFLTDSLNRGPAVDVIAERWGKATPKAKAKPKAKPKAEPKEAPKPKPKEAPKPKPAEEPKGAGRMWKDLEPVDEGGEVIVKVGDVPTRGKVVTDWKKGRLKYTVEITEGPSKGKLVAGLRRSDLNPVPPKAEPKPAVKEMPKAKPKGKPTQTEEDQLNFFDRAFEVKNGRYIDPKRGGVIHPLVVREMSRAGLGAFAGAGFNVMFSDTAPNTTLMDKITAGAVIGASLAMSQKMISTLAKRNKTWQIWMTGGGRLVGVSKRFGADVYKETRAAMSQLGGRAAQGERKISQAAGELFAAVKKEYGKGPGRVFGITSKQNPFAVIKKEAPDVYKKIQGFMNGENDLAGVPEDIATAVRKMRFGMDDMSRELVDGGYVEGPLVAKFMDGIGSYLKRAYQIFDDPKWKTAYDEMTGKWIAPKGVDPEKWQQIVNRFMTWYEEESMKRFGTELTDDELRAAVIQFTNVGPDGTIPYIANKRLGRIHPHDLAKRNENLDRAVRELWGEYEDPFINFVQTVTKQHRLLANAEWLTRLKGTGLKGGFAVEGKGKMLPDGTAGTYIPENDFRYGALRGHTLHQDFADELAKHMEAEGVRNGIARTWMALMSWSKVAKTVLSPVTHVRNTVGNTSFAWINGYNPWTIGKYGYKSVGDVLRAAGWKAADGEQLDFVNNMVRLGVIDDNANAVELHNAIKEVLALSPEELWEGGSKRSDGFVRKLIGTSQGASRVVRSVYGGSQTLYRAEDDLWKLISFQIERDRYRGIVPDSQLDEYAAEITKNVFPTFSLTPELVNKTRRYGGFISFPAEVYRTTKNTVEQIHKEISSDNPKIKAIGYRRAAGAISYGTTMVSLTAASKFIFGVTDEEEDAVRSSTMWWNENSNMLFLGKPKDGKYLYLDTSYLLPHSYLLDPITAVLRGENYKNSLMGAMKEVASPFLGAPPLLGELIEATETAHLAADFEHPYMRAMFSGLSPGGWDQFSRIVTGETASGREVHRGVEAFAVASGIRGTAADSRDTAEYILRSLSLRLSRQMRPLKRAEERGAAGGRWERFLAAPADAIINKMKSNAPRVVQDYIDRSLVKKTEGVMNDHLLAAAEAMRAAIILGVPSDEVEGWLKKHAVPKEYRQILIDATVLGLRPKTRPFRR